MEVVKNLGLNPKFLKVKDRKTRMSLSIQES